MDSTDEEFHSMAEYHAPKWCAGLLKKPTHRIPLAMTPTPIHPWKVPGIPTGYEVYVKRDDMTGCALGGNKTRCLEFLLAEAKVRGCSAVITSGSTHSNHCRSTIIAAKQVGLDCHLIMRDKDGDCETVTASGNSLLIQAFDPDIYLLPWNEFTDENLEEKFPILADHILKTTGKHVYVIPPGGSNEIGLHGYLCAWEEMIKQGLFERFDDVVFGVGSGGTARSLAIANYLTGRKIRLHAVSVSRPAENIHSGINATMKRVGITGVVSEDLIDVIDGYSGRGYSMYEEDDIAFYKNIAKATGIYCDQVYTGKAIKGLVGELQKNPSRFKGKRILFIHTGGLFGAMETGVSRLYQGDAVKKIKQWKDVFPED